MEISTQKKYERLAINIDNFDDGKGDVAVILYVPHTDFPEHEHIRLDLEAAKQLHQWLGNFIDNK
jgi:hypothetical protein